MQWSPLTIPRQLNGAVFPHPFLVYPSFHQHRFQRTEYNRIQQAPQGVQGAPCRCNSITCLSVSEAGEPTRVYFRRSSFLFSLFPSLFFCVYPIVSLPTTSDNIHLGYGYRAEPTFVLGMHSLVPRERSFLLHGAQYSKCRARCSEDRAWYSE